MLDKMKTQGFKLAAALIVIVNLGMFANINLVDKEVVKELVLDERELSWGRITRDENSGLSLRMDYTVFSVHTGPGHHSHRHSHAYNAPDWLTKEKMLSLGFSEDAFIQSGDLGYKIHLEKDVYFALEFNGDTYQSYLKHLQADLFALRNNPDSVEKDVERAEEKLNGAVNETSRLMVIDAELRQGLIASKYQDKSNVIIVKGSIAPRVVDEKEPHASYGRIEGLSPREIYIPYPLNQSVIDLDEWGWDDRKWPRYQVTLQFGHAYRARVAAVKKI